MKTKIDKMNLKFLKVRDVKTPVRGDGLQNDLSAGLDFFVPEFDGEFGAAVKTRNNPEQMDYDGERILLYPNSRCLIPSGIKLNLQTINGVTYSADKGVALIAHNRGSLGSKGIIHGACVVDEDFQGEIFLSIINTTAEPFSIRSGDKLLQFVLIPIFTPQLVEVGNESDLYDSISKRGVGELGSTNK